MPLRIALELWAAFPGWARAAAATALAFLFIYEGVPPFPLKLPLIGEISIIDGRVDNVREAADERCRLQKNESRRLAEQADRLEENSAAREHATQVKQLSEIATTAQEGLRDYERDIERLETTVQECRKATSADDARVQPPRGL